MFSSLAAEDRVIAGTPFSVDEIAPVDALSYRVRVGSVESIVPNSGVDDLIVRSYFSDRALFQRLGGAAVEQFVRQSLTNKLPAYTQYATVGLLRFGDPSDPRTIALVEELAALDEALPVLKGVLEDLPSGFSSTRIICALLYGIGSRDITWLRTHNVKLLYMYGGELKLFLKEKFHSTIADVHSSVPTVVTKFLGEAFGLDDPEYKRLNVLLLKVNKIREGLTSADPSAVFPFLDLTDDDPQVSGALQPLVTDAIHRGAELAIGRNDFLGGLGLLSKVDFAKRTPTTHALMKRALEGLDPQSADIVRRSDVVAALVRFGEKDAGIKDVFSRFLREAFDVHLERGALETAEQIVRVFASLYPGGFGSTDEMRVSLAIGYLKRDRRDDSERVLRELDTGLSLFQTLRLGLVRAVSSTGSRILVAAGALLLLTLVAVRIRRHLPSLDAPRQSNAEEAEHTRDRMDSIHPQFVTLRGGASPMSEYERCLRMFGLSGDPDMREIKSAYRSLIKQLHPDQSQGTIDPDKFLEIKHAYEKLIEIRRGLGLDVDGR